MTEQAQNIVKTLTKGGATGIIIAMIMLVGYIIWSGNKTTEMNNVLIGNHIDHSNQALNNVAESNVIFAEAITELSTIIQLNR